MGGVAARTVEVAVMLERFESPVRCAEGHVFTSIWVPLGSLKAVRLGDRRYQRCPVGHHWTSVSRLDQGTMTDEEREAAAAVHDVRIP